MRLTNIIFFIKQKVLLIALMTFLYDSFTMTMAEETVITIDFESRDLTSWKEFPLLGKAKFELVEENGNHFLRASCGEASESSFQYPINLELRPGTKLRWRWRMVSARPGFISSFTGWGNFPGRMYVYFKPTPDFLPNAALAYVWTLGLRTQGWIQSPNPAPHRYQAIEYGDEKEGKWIQEERDIYQDFMEALGKEPPHAYALGILVEAVGEGGVASFDYDDIQIITPNKNPPSRDF